MILNHRDESFPTVINMTLFWRKIMFSIWRHSQLLLSFILKYPSVRLDFFCTLNLKYTFLDTLGSYLRAFLSVFPKIHSKKNVLWSEICILCHFLAYFPSSQVDQDGQIWVALGFWLLCRDISRCMLNFVTIFIFRPMGGPRILLGPQNVTFSGIFAQLSGGPLWSDLSSSGFMASL